MSNSEATGFDMIFCGTGILPVSDNIPTFSVVKVFLIAEAIDFIFLLAQCSVWPIPCLAHPGASLRPIPNSPPFLYIAILNES